MSDELMDERLRAAGERWRAEDTAEPIGTAVDLEVSVAPTHRRRWVTSSAGAGVAAAAVVIALITGVIAVTYRDGNRAGTAGSVPQQLAGVTWTVGGNPLISLVFLPGAVRRYDGCSNGLYRLRVHDDQMTLGRPIGSLSVCGGGSTSRTVTTFNRVVSGTFQWAANGDRLTLTRPGAGTLVLTNDGSRAPSLVGTDWQLTQISGVGNESVSVPPSGAGLSINSAGRFEAGDGCNTLSSHATTRLDSFVLGPVYETAMGCIDPKIGAASTVIDRVLSGTVPFTVRGDELIIARGGLGLLVYTAAPTRAAVSSTSNTPAAPTKGR